MTDHIVETAEEFSDRLTDEDLCADNSEERFSFACGCSNLPCVCRRS